MPTSKSSKNSKEKTKRESKETINRESKESKLKVSSEKTSNESKLKVSSEKTSNESKLKVSSEKTSNESKLKVSSEKTSTELKKKTKPESKEMPPLDPKEFIKPMKSKESGDIVDIKYGFNLFIKGDFLKTIKYGNSNSLDSVNKLRKVTQLFSHVPNNTDFSLL